ncbi:MAG: N-6 DNA methylase [Alphaproteobacteria bacterium]
MKTNNLKIAEQLFLYPNDILNTQIDNSFCDSILPYQNKKDNRLSKYNLEKYIEDVKNLGLSSTWDKICEYLLSFGENKEFLTISNLSDMYEMGLAIANKCEKKKHGQYYTPDDVAEVMANWFDKCEGKNICDVGCGTGNLILTYLNYIGTEKAISLINSGCLYLYDIDKVALKICKTSIIVKYNICNHNCIHDFCCDFMNKKIILPSAAKVISNPPYTSIKSIENTWNMTDVLLDTKELYSIFMEKIFEQSMSSVIITPFSFISGKKFYTLRKKMCKIGGGVIFSFDNVPGNIFCGKKYGIFNTNTTNSVRAAITIFNKKENKGFKISPLIRFKNEERKHLLKCEVLQKVLPYDLQLIDKNSTKFAKVNKELYSVFNKWIESSQFKLKNIICKDFKYTIYMPNTCRYYTTGAFKNLNRTGEIIINLQTEEEFNFVYCFINSSFVYWWWRIYDGGITYPISLLLEIPLPLNLLSEEDGLFFRKMTNKMISEEQHYIITKMNAGSLQENIKFPKKYRNSINQRLLKILGFTQDSQIFNLLHSNTFIGTNSDE